MVGIGPEWIHTNETGKSPNSVSAEAVVDVMFWPSKNTDSVGMWNRATSVILAVDMNNRLESAAAC